MLNRTLHQAQPSQPAQITPDAFHHFVGAGEPSPSLRLPLSEQPERDQGCRGISQARECLQLQPHATAPLGDVLENLALCLEPCEVLIAFKAGRSCWSQCNNWAGGKHVNSDGGLCSGGSRWVLGCGGWLPCKPSSKTVVVILGSLTPVKEFRKSKEGQTNFRLWGTIWLLEGAGENSYPLHTPHRATDSSTPSSATPISQKQHLFPC